MPKGNPAVPSCGHPDRRVKGHGKCQECYDHEYVRRPDRRIRDREKAAEWRERNRDRARYLDFRKHVVRKYGITMEQYEQFVAEHDNRCAICGSRQSRGHERLCVDHCHDTGEIRGLLCHRCNTAIGLFLSDHSLLEAAAFYLDRHERKKRRSPAA
jgi:hypothetical protein